MDINYKTTTFILAILLVVSAGTSLMQKRNHDHHHTHHDMHNMMMDMSDRMRAVTGTERDRVFLEDMIVHHQGALDMAEVLLETTTNPQLIELASGIITAQEREINMMQAWLAEWFQ
ncbi:MAG: DUF305 domain-containing protein [Candidatus Pacebacteria bacterium]|nr:DUF305 domain-containing protein [Candidatus Paceibacterota bacterium]MCD8508192.1 DUF305 domain-containing protein [Candidatus Paceibacterota bacterium]MCD8528176.1 DUF305 domain-containing protein [Candidatus Paceibacterota bacterium]MCD8563445.1 DUF305 domain-containing protein [Candidatus Paceibacterota bacterium]